MKIDFKLVEWVQVINDNQCHININGDTKLLEFDKMKINDVTYKNSSEFVSVNKLKIKEELAE
jgi:hypothetical protein